jgi:hypothetical protein
MRFDPIKTGVSCNQGNRGAAYSGAIPPDSPSPPSDLAFLIERWSTLTPALRAQIVALAESEAGGLSLAAEGAPFGCSQIFWFASCHLQDRFPWN